MREILFRGKRVDNCEWAYGYYTVCRVTDDHVIDGKECNHVVIPGTVGQYTGENDKNGRKIFEGDIVRVNDKYVDAVIFSNGCFCMESQIMMFEFTYQCFDEIEVIGNIHDNPELLKEGK